MHIYSEILLGYKKGQILSFAMWMDLEIIMLSEKVRQRLYYHLYAESKN